MLVYGPFLNALLKLAGLALAFIARWQNNSAIFYIISIVLLIISGIIECHVEKLQKAEEETKAEENAKNSNRPMTSDEFQERCYFEFYDKNPNVRNRVAKLEKVLKYVVGIIVFVICVMVYTTSFLSPDQETDVFSAVFTLALMIIIPLVLTKLVTTFIINPIIICSLCKLPYNTIMQAEKDKSYSNYPIDYPYSILYPGETYPFDGTEAPTMNETPAPAFKTASQPEAPISAPVPAPAPESIVITCEKCGQQMLIPSGSGTVKITCPKCGSDIIHTYGN